MRKSSDGFLRYERRDAPKRPVDQRLGDCAEIELDLPSDQLVQQAERCMDCGIPFCHSYGCPVNNRVPEFIELAHQGFWRDALELLHSTDNFPEITGRVCPAPCETACTLGINQPPVTIRQIELRIVERGFDEGWIKPEPALERTGRKIAIIGSGPAGLAASQQLARLGHSVTLFERQDRIGGLMRYGIPDFKLDKKVLDRRLKQLAAEGVIFETGVDVGVDISANYLDRSFDAVLLTVGSGVPRDLPLPERDAAGIHFAMEFLCQQNHLVSGNDLSGQQRLSAEGKNVVVIGGGDTGSDCIGTANRQHTASVTQIELLPRPPQQRPAENPWPTWPQVLRSSSSHEEGCERMWSIGTKRFIVEQERVSGLSCVRLEWSVAEDGRRTFREIPGSEFQIKAELVLLAMGFVHPEQGPLVHHWALTLDQAGNIAVDQQMSSSRPGVFVAGDAARGASLIVHAIDSGRRAAAAIDEYLG
ncbi:MAG: glutamate synthase subunit beta [Candidatus Alcyoniella australis]|nr:glutamate synthase subunit beta [Candidatus Alcyoniella australis]